MKLAGSAKVFTCACVALLLVSSVTAGSVTTAYLYDTSEISQTLEAGSTFPPDDSPYYINPDNEVTIIDNEDLYDFDMPDVRLRIPENVNPVEGGNKQPISMRAGTISSEVDISTKNEQIDIDAVNGDVDMEGTTIERTGGSHTNGIAITAADDVNLDNSIVRTKSQPISVDAGGTLSLRDATVELTDGGAPVELLGGSVNADRITSYNRNDEIILEASTDYLNATQGQFQIDGGSGDLTMGSDGDGLLNSSSIDLGNGQASIDLGAQSSTIYVHNTVILTNDDTLYYTPSGVTVGPDARDGDDVQPGTN